MQIKRIAGNIRALFFLIDKLQQRTWRKEKFLLNQVFHKLDNNKCKCTRAHVQENKSIYLSIYLSIWKPFWKRVYIYIFIFFEWDGLGFGYERCFKQVGEFYEVMFRSEDC